MLELEVEPGCVDRVMPLALYYSSSQRQGPLLLPHTGEPTTFFEPLC